MSAELPTEAPEASAKGRTRYPPTERGVRVRVYPFEDQEVALIARGRAFRPSAPMTFCMAYDGRKSDEHHVADKAFHVPTVGVLPVGTGRGHMPEAMTRCPNERRGGVPKHASARCASPGSANAVCPRESWTEQDE